MTMLALHGLAASRARGVLGVALAVVVLALLPVTLFVDLARGSCRWVRLWLALRQTIAYCPVGHPVPLAGHYVCENCHLVLDNWHAWRPSVCCGSVPDAVICSCGRAIRSPVRWLR